MAECYQVKKGAVIFSCLLNCVIYIFLAGFIEIAIANSYNWFDNRAQEKATIIVIVAVVIGVVFQLVGLIGTLCENSCLLLAYLIITVLLAAAVLIKGFTDFFNLKIYWAGSMWFAINAVLVVTLLKAMKRVHRERETAQGTINVNGESYGEIV